MLSKCVLVYVGALLVGMQMDTATVENSVELPQKIKDGSALWPSDHTSRYTSEETQNTNSEEYVYSYVHCNIIYNRQYTEVTRVHQ